MSTRIALMGLLSFRSFAALASPVAECGPLWKTFTSVADGRLLTLEYKDIRTEVALTKMVEVAVKKQFEGYAAKNELSEAQRTKFKSILNSAMEGVHNALRYGGERDATQTADLTITFHAGGVHVTITDRGPRFDPSQFDLKPMARGREYQKAYRRQIGKDPEGGFGLYLMVLVADRATYSYKSGNRFDLDYSWEPHDNPTQERAILAGTKKLNVAP